MKEIKDIIEAYETALTNQQGMALATVVKVEGSSYRQAGARMLVTDDGRLTGAISGGCLEGDALKKALLSIHQRTNKLITYDTTHEENASLGVQLGCNGIVHILFEYINPEQDNHPLSLLKRALQQRVEAVLVTLFSLKHKNDQVGTVLLSLDDASLIGPQGDLDLTFLQADIQQARRNKKSHLKICTLNGLDHEALIEFIAPVLRLYSIGAGNDVKPLVESADIMGWECHVIDGRATHALAARFPKAHMVTLSSSADLCKTLDVDPYTVFALMTHNYSYDIAALEFALNSPTPYIGVLGPKSKLSRMFTDLSQAGIVLDDSAKARIYGPLGLDIGAETAEEIAIAIVAEIKAVMSGRNGHSLKFLPHKIHTAIEIMP